MEPCGAAVARRGRAPFTSGQQAGLVVFMMHAAAGIADQIGGVALAFGPADARPSDRGHVAAVLESPRKQLGTTLSSWTVVLLGAF